TKIRRHIVELFIAATLKGWPEYRKLVSGTESRGKEPRDGWGRWRGNFMGYRPMRELGFFEHHKRDRFRCQK
ncbi:MAG: hypothetical protein WAK57_18070, partial [Desulfobacterales bacterium]